MSREALDWALEFAPPMPPQLVSTLSGLARHADRQGRGAFPSVARLAAYACKSERSIQRDLKDLLALGLVRPGDQSKVAHLPEGKRPEVYDLALERVIAGGRAGSDEATRASRVTLTSSRARGGRKKPSSDAIADPETGDVGVRGDAHVTGDAHVGDGVTPTSQEGRRPRHPNQKKNLKTEEGGARSVPAAARRGDGLHALPDEFALTDAMRRWSLMTFGPGIDVDHETAQFVSHFRAEGVRKKSWPDAWQKWMRRAAQYASERQQRPRLRAVNGSPEDRGIF